MNPKRVLALLLSPAAHLRPVVGRLGRVWAHARLKALLGEVDLSVVVEGVPEVHGTGRIHLGKNLLLYRDLYLETRAEGSIEIGDNVVLSRGVHLVAHAAIRIGANSMIGEYTSIRDANHRFGDGARIRTSGFSARPIDIGQNVWIGRGAAILRGVAIGDNCVIGANSVVTHDVPSDSVMGGIPAHPLRRMVSR